MRLRPKILLMLTGVLAVSLVASVVIQHSAVYPRFVALERDEALKDWARSRAAIDREIEHLSRLCLDWSSWTDTYNFALGKFPGYYESNIGKLEWFSEQSLDLFFVCAPDGRVVWGQVLDLNTLEPARVSWVPTEGLGADHPLLRVRDDKDSEVRGLYQTELGLMMFASRPILTSQNEGPRAGVLIFGRLLSEDAIEMLREQTHVDFAIETAGDPDVCATGRAKIAAAMGTRAPQVDTDSSRSLRVRGPLFDITGAPIGVIKARLARHITEEGQAALRFAMLSLLGTGAATLLILIMGLGRMVITPLVGLTDHATQIAASGDLRRRIAAARSDELGVLASRFNEMMAQLEEYRSRAVSMSRQAGMAETATGVLHNVGNALTNANVVAETLSEKLAQSRASTLSKAVTLMAEHERDLARFLTEDPRGKQLPSYLGQLASHLAHETAENARDLESLREGLRHIREIVDAQQDLARSSSVSEPLDAGEIVEKAVASVRASMTRHEIQVRITGAAASRVVADRSKLQQVLVNLLTNAKDAICAQAGSSRIIEVRMGERGEGQVVIEVVDTGIGIHADHKGKLFANGFSTKAHGHGFGLHSSAIAIGEMGGTMSAESPGPGHGATFRIALPAHRMSVQEVTA